MSHDAMKTVLVIEDDAAIAEFVRLVLDMEGYRVRQATNGVLGLQALRTERPDLLLLDLGLPGGLDGWGVLQAVQGDTALQRVPVAILTAFGSADVEDRARSLGTRDVLYKPLGASQLASRVARILDE